MTAPRTMVCVVALAAVLALGAGACSNDPDKPGPADGSSLNFDVKATIRVADGGIDPAITHVRTGEAIAVVNAGTQDHGLTSDSIDTGLLHPGESTIVYFTSAGTIDVRDRTNPSHTAKIDVAG